MAVTDRVSTGIPGFDATIDMLRLGDNVVWLVQSVEDYLQVVGPYIQQAKEDGRRIVYFRFGFHEALLDDGDPDVCYEVDASEGFESFATKIHSLIEKEGKEVFYVFDCLSDLLEFWYSDLMIGNFFRVTCPFLYQLDTIAYFALIRNVHTHNTIARIRETTQLLLDTYSNQDNVYIHPLKVWGRHSPTMFLPHLIEGGKALPITSSADLSALSSALGPTRQPRDYWDITLDRARLVLENGEDQSEMKELLVGLIMGKNPRITKLIDSYFSLQDLLDIASRKIGTGLVGGKSVGMLLARKILDIDMPEDLQNYWEPHDSYYLGSDVFYTYIVQNGWWELRVEQKTAKGYFSLAPELRENLLKGEFPAVIREQFYQMLEYYGQSPIIVRSSSLLEDDFGNAFAGKYESVFCANQGSPEERFEVFVQAVRTVYASSMSEEALAYRERRGLSGTDEQMAILVQRVSGDHYDDLFFPHIAGVGHSSNLYVWTDDMDPAAGMLRLVFGLGTRAVDRISGDYARIVSLDRPDKGPLVSHGKEGKFSQHKADVLDLRKNLLTETSLSNLWSTDLKTDRSTFFSVDSELLARYREIGRSLVPSPQILDLKKLLSETEFPALTRKLLHALETAYDYPVDIEFTANFKPNGSFKFNLLQCRPLQTKGLGHAVSMPEAKPEEILFSSVGNFMGGNVRLPIDYVIFIKTKGYLSLTEQKKYEVARLIGALNQEFKDSSIMLIGPGRWGTTTPSLGVPIHFNELSNMTVLCEISYRQAGLMPELSFGSHFFQDLVEADMTYAAIFDGEKDVVFRPERVLDTVNLLGDVLPEDKAWEDVIHLAQTPGLTLYSDITSQRVLCSS